MTAAEHLDRAEKYIAEAERQMYREQNTGRATAYAALATAHAAIAEAKESSR